MKNLIITISLLFVTAAALYAQDTRTLVHEDGGLGPYKAVIVSDASLSTHTIFKPQDLSAFNKDNPLPVLVWGNGACRNTPYEHVNFLNEIASHGFIVIAIGPMPENFDSLIENGGSDSELLTYAIDWIIAQNENPQSQYYNKIDVWNIAAGGMSCGGLQTLDVAKDPRLNTVMICNSGLFKVSNASSAVPGMPMPTKDRLTEIHTPIIYILGGESDIAYENGMDDFSQINHVPIFAANLNVGHGGTYAQPHGGAFSTVATAWLKWQLKGDAKAGQLFKGSPCGLLSIDGWRADKKNIP